MRNRSVLLIAFHYPPCATSSGLQRSLSFSIHLRNLGWQPRILTVNPAAYERTSDNQLDDIPPDVAVHRTWALDAARHLAVGGRYWARLAVPDRWTSWRLTAVPRGLALIRHHRVDAIWSTYPIATAHRVAATLARLTGLPWIADFRDPMVERVHETGELFPTDPVLREARLGVEARVACDASRMVFCTAGARQIFLERYPAIDSNRCVVIPNGFEEQAFRDAGALRAAGPPGGRRVLLHSGTIYPGPDRDPTALMQAIRRLVDRGLIDARNFELRLRDPSNADYFKRLAAGNGIGNLVTVLPALSYREALAEMLDADALLLLQGATSNPAVPAKLYEYLRARRPIMALVHPAGETAATLRAVGINAAAPLADADSIASLLSMWLGAARNPEALLPSPELVHGYSREGLSAGLAALLDEACDSVAGASTAARGR